MQTEVLHIVMRPGITPDTVLAHNSEITLERSNTHLIIDVPFACPEHLFYRRYANCLGISSDLRALYDASCTVSSTGLLSLLVLGTTTPPFTVFNEISLFRPGFRHSINIETLRIDSEEPLSWPGYASGEGIGDGESDLDLLIGKMDFILADACRGKYPMLLFSGGVDSSFIAARLAALGWTKLPLLHLSFGRADEQTSIARGIADRLCLPLEVVDWDVNEGLDCLPNAARLYRQPFCDHSCVPTFLLAKRVIAARSSNAVVLDGTGADGVFGLYAKAGAIQRLAQLPLPCLKLVGAFYRRLSLWSSASRAAHYCEVCRRMSALAPISAAIAQNALMNIGYKATAMDRSAVSEACEHWITLVSNSDNVAHNYPLLDIGLTCAGIFAQKATCILAAENVDIEFPFLKPVIVDLGINYTPTWDRNETPKAMLKYALSTMLPAEWIYREKQGFTAPTSDIFNSPIFLEHLSYALATTSPIYAYCDSNFLRKARDLLLLKRRLSSQTYNFLWAVVFVNSWLAGIQAPGDQTWLHRNVIPLQAENMSCTKE